MSPQNLSMLTIACPRGTAPGATVGVTTPDGQQLQVTVPANISEGQEFSVAYTPLVQEVATAVAQGVAVQHDASTVPLARPLLDHDGRIIMAAQPQQLNDFYKQVERTRWLYALVPIIGIVWWCQLTEQLREHPGNPRPGCRPPLCTDGECDFD